jgi:hypothetical protein
VTSNPYLKRLLGEAGTPAEFPPPENIPPPAQDDPQDQAQEQEQIDPGADPQAAPQGEAAPQVQELVQQWQSGEHMGVAARLMFSEASYVTFVDLCFVIGQDAGRELGELLDELADTQGIEPPETPPEYRSVLQRVAGADEEEGVL